MGNGWLPSESQPSEKPVKPLGDQPSQATTREISSSAGTKAVTISELVPTAELHTAVAANDGKSESNLRARAQTSPPTQTEEPNELDVLKQVLMDKSLGDFATEIRNLETVFPGKKVLKVMAPFMEV